MNKYNNHSKSQPANKRRIIYGSKGLSETADTQATRLG